MRKLVKNGLLLLSLVLSDKTSDKTAKQIRLNCTPFYET